MTTYCSLGYEIAKTHKALRARLQAALLPHNITVPQWEVLRTLGTTPGITAAQLVESVISDSSTMMAILKRLESKFLILRKMDGTDRRTRRIYLTGDGRALTRKLSDIAEEHNRSLQAGCSPQELQVVTRVLARLSSRHRMDSMPGGDIEHAGNAPEVNRCL